ncbi:MAG: hypothetical protein GF341_12230 [candidate division Zixibacteria bacterium]|nr:hypothetical protein [candidate division Zixibacteria bacterium]
MSDSTQPASSDSATPAWSEPRTTRLVFLPTYHVLPAGSGTFGLTEIVVPNISMSPTSFLHVTASASVIPVGFLSGGIKAQLLHRNDNRAGLAVGASYLGFYPADNEFSLTTGFLTGGIAIGSVEYHASLMLARVKTEESSVFSIDLPSESYPGTNRDDIDYIPLVGAGFKAPLPGNANLLFETWGWGDNGEIALLGLPAIQYFGDGFSAQVGTVPVLIADEIEARFIPWLVLTRYFD